MPSPLVLLNFFYTAGIPFLFSLISLVVLKYCPRVTFVYPLSLALAYSLSHFFLFGFPQGVPSNIRDWGLVILWGITFCNIGLCLKTPQKKLGVVLGFILFLFLSFVPIVDPLIESQSFPEVLLSFSITSLFLLLFVTFPPLFSFSSSLQSTFLLTVSLCGIASSFIYSSASQGQIFSILFTFVSPFWFLDFVFRKTFLSHPLINTSLFFFLSYQLMYLILFLEIPLYLLGGLFISLVILYLLDKRSHNLSWYLRLVIFLIALFPLLIPLGVSFYKEIIENPYPY